ncbi:MAG: hypothetical protein DBW65_00920 [Alphaproteobacteria bacterium]|nr:MAG: hypothetical protein DBW65_00920 [Alphaproteobacteria bacterium]|tara:strand:+ start:49 stop:642 length:594 start_codon:yes stop_codon:yes gene_type:complete
MYKKSYFILLLTLYFFCGCATNKNYLIQDINFDNHKSFTIDAARLIVEQKYNTNISYPYIDHLVKQDLVSLVSSWSIARLNTETSNNIGNLKVIINEASIKALPISDNNKIEELFMSNADINIEMNLDVNIDLLNEKGNRISYVNIKVFKSQELGGNISLLEKDYKIQEMSRYMMMDFDSLAINKIKEVFNKRILSN